MFPRNRCMHGCPANSFCQFGFCECNPGLTKSMVRAPFLSPPKRFLPQLLDFLHLKLSPLSSLFFFTSTFPDLQGACYPDNQRPPPRASDFQPFRDCTTTSTCAAIDMNLICNTNLTIGGQVSINQCDDNLTSKRSVGSLRE